MLLDGLIMRQTEIKCQTEKQDILGEGVYEIFGRKRGLQVQFVEGGQDAGLVEPEIFLRATGFAQLQKGLHFLGFHVGFQDIAHH